MKIAVLGSWRRGEAESEWKLEHNENFIPACQALGEALAERGHELVIARAADDTADKYAAEPFLRPDRQDRLMCTGLGIHTAPGAAHIAAVEHADAVVIIAGAHGSYAAGVAALLTRKRLVPVGCFGGAARELIAYLPEPVAAIRTVLNDLSPRSPTWTATLTRTVLGLLEAYPRILIIHGRRPDRQKVKSIIEQARSEFPEIPDPVILQEHTLDANTIPEMFEAMATQVDAAIAVVTPDDLGAAAVNGQGVPLLAADLCELELRARENVWVEVGWFWGRLGRDKLMILRKGDRVNVPTDLGAVINHAYSRSPDERRAEILDFLRVLRTGRRTPSSSNRRSEVLRPRSASNTTARKPRRG